MGPFRDLALVSVMGSLYTLQWQNFLIFTFIYLFIYLFFRATSEVYGSSQAKSRIVATAASLYHNQSNSGSEPHLRSTPQLMAIPDPRPPEQGQGSNPHAHGY